jgi:NAD(P)-dependent dehydrogenase (short-subunit alcohol dehydrogenase family)
MSLLPALLLALNGASGCDSAKVPAQVWIKAPASLDTAGLGLTLARRFALRDRDSLLVDLELETPVALQQLAGTLYKQVVNLRLGRLGDSTALRLQVTALGDSPKAAFRKAIETIKPTNEQIDVLYGALSPRQSLN